MFKRLFGGQDAPAAPALAVVRNITIGRTVALDPLAWRRLGDQTKFILDRDVLDITAQGTVTLDSGQFVHRFYTEDHLMLQAMSDDAAGMESYDFTLFMPWTSAYPAGERERRIWKDRLSEPVFHGAAESLPDYPRFWFEESDGRQPPVTIWETVWDDRAARAPYSKIFQTCMLYARDLPDGRELMLALEMQPENARGERGDLSHEIMIGIPLEMAEFRA
ncbi:YjfK family protein [Brevundimonas goettingensis]|uniref:YjfK family protein n=1 Tax=Brevundimonas goettingensis TaxID=2774190 RepID=A0A975GUH4_9CAUL|nr:YjfK family protein [Brevundimonas goettingensis]QTC90086.1 YjfK family protein [Brevundimonas goettingensis]